MPPTIPATGPDMSSCVGRDTAPSIVSVPPLDAMRWKSVSGATSRSAVCMLRRYRLVFGPMYASSAVVENRSYSRCCGTTSWLIERWTPGSSSSRISFTRRSCSGLRNENRKQTATASTCASRSAAAAVRTSPSSSGTSTSPGGTTRSETT